MQSHFEINVSRNGRHLFATAPRSLDDVTERGEKAAFALANEIKGAFSDCEVTVTRWTTIGSVQVIH